MSASSNSVFVTGGSRGIGRAVVYGCLARGFDVAFTHLDTAAERLDVQSLLADVYAAFPVQRCSGYVLDVRDSAAVDLVARKVVDEFGTISGVVCNAGVNVVRLTSRVPDDEWDDIIRTNLTGVFYTCRAFLEHMVTNRRGRIVLISSLNRDGASGTAAYSASKAAIIGLAGSIAKEYGTLGITCNCVAPGFVNTSFLHGKMDQAMEQFWISNCSVGRLGRANEVADAIAFLLSDRASLINGVTLPLTAGLDWFP